MCLHVGNFNVYMVALGMGEVIGNNFGIYCTTCHVRWLSLCNRVRQEVIFSFCSVKANTFHRSYQSIRKESPSIQKWPRAMNRDPMRIQRTNLPFSMWLLWCMWKYRICLWKQQDSACRWAQPFRSSGKQEEPLTLVIPVYCLLTWKTPSNCHQVIRNTAAVCMGAFMCWWDTFNLFFLLW